MSVTEPLRFAGMAGISIAGRDAAPSMLGQLAEAIA
jgi:hypothetical protein